MMTNELTNELFEALNTNDAHLSDELINCDERLLWFLSQNTHMTKSEIKRQIAGGVGDYRFDWVL